MRRGRLRLPRPLGRLLQLLAFLFVVNTFVLPQLAGTREAIELIGSLDPRLLALGVAAEAASLAAVAHLIRTLVVEPHRPSAWVTNRIVLASRAASRVVPGGAAAGGVLSYRLLRRSGVPTSEAGFSIATQSLEQAAVLVAILFLATVVSIPLGGFDLVYVVAATVGAAVLLGLFVVVLAITRGEDGAVERARRIARATRVLDEDRVEALLRSLGSQLRQLADQPGELWRHIRWSAAYWLFDALALAIFLAAYGHWTRPDGLLVAYGLANVVAILPITPGGLGVMEATLSASLVGFGVPPGIALLGVVSWRLVNYWIPIPLGAAAYLSLRVDDDGTSAVENLERLADEARRDADETLPWRRRRHS